MTVKYTNDELFELLKKTDKEQGEAAATALFLSLGYERYLDYTNWALDNLYYPGFSHCTKDELRQQFIDWWTDNGGVVA